MSTMDEDGSHDGSAGDGAAHAGAFSLLQDAPLTSEAALVSTSTLPPSTASLSEIGKFVWMSRPARRNCG